jgi:LysM repeat protein
MRRWLILAIIAVIGLGLAAVQGADETTLSIPSLEVPAGTNEVYEININCLADGCIAFDITLRFDPKRIQVDDVEVGPYLGENFYVVRDVIDPENGTARLAVAALGQLPPSAENVLLRLYFSTLESGSVNFTVDHLDMSDRHGLPVAVEIMSKPAAATPPPSAVPVPVVTCEYVVRAGDTLTGIALANSVTIEAIMTLNNIADARFISVGQKLQIPTDDCKTGLGSSGGSGQQRSGNRVYFEVWDCRHLGNNVFEWYGVEISYDSANNPISEQRVDGPHTGEWRPGCPAGERPSGGGGRRGGGDDDDGGSGGPTIPA